MQERNLRVLEYPKILERLASMAMTEPGKAAARALRPSGDINEVRRLQQETEEALSAYAYHGGSPMAYFSDVSEYLQLAKVGSTLSMKALLTIAEGLRAARTVRNALVSDREDTRALSAIASELATNRPVGGRNLQRHPLRGRNGRPRQPGTLRHPPPPARPQRPRARPAQRHHPLLVPAKVLAGRHHHHAQRALRHPRARRQPAVRAGAGARPVRQRLDAVHRAGGGRGGRQRDQAVDAQGAAGDRPHPRRVHRPRGPGRRPLPPQHRGAGRSGHDLCPRRPRPRDARRAAEDQRGGPRQPHARPPSAHRPGKGRALHPVDGRRVHHAGHHRPQHRRQDGDAEDRGAACPDGAVRPADPRRLRQRTARVRRGVRRHRRRAVHRAVAFHLFLAHDQHRRHSAGGDAPVAGAV